MSRRRFPIPLVLALGLVIPLSAQSGLGNRTLAGDREAALRYVDWAGEAVKEERWDEAEAALERGADFSDVSSDISYLLALVRSRRGRPRGAVLEALRRALETDRWDRYTPAEGRLLEAETLIALRLYPEALRVLAPLPSAAETDRLRLIVFKNLGRREDFRRFMTEALDRYPWDPRFPRLLLEYAAERLPQGNEGDLIDLVLRRLPFLLEVDPELVCGAVPFIRDPAEASRLLGGYRAVFTPSLASIPPALNLGLIDEDQAVNELFQNSPLDKALIQSVWDLLRHDPGRDLFRRNLLSFSGVITEDADGDGFPEVRVVYGGGAVTEYAYDTDQDGLTDLRIFFAAGVPREAELVMLPELSGGIETPFFAFPVRDEERTKALIRWDQYPFVLRVESEGTSYILRPRDFSFNPLTLKEFIAGGRNSFLFPARNSPYGRLSTRPLVSFSRVIERPSPEFPGALERLDMDRGIPQKSTEFLSGRIVAVTEFLLGRPRIQRVDLDLDGRLETIRRFRTDLAGESDTEIYKRDIESSESDWDGDGIFETGEQYFPDGRLLRSWDMDKDGSREYSEWKESEG
jgi:tetratricopeptide (TPR) repeat protein